MCAPKLSGKLFALALLIAQSFFAHAQSPFTEGVLEYAVSIEKMGEKQKQSGTLQIFVKAGNVRKELVLASGFKNVMLLSAGPQAYSLRKMGNDNCALVFDKSSRRAQHKRCTGMKMVPLNKKENPRAGFPAKAAVLVCSAGDSVRIVYSDSLSITNQDMFEAIPEFGFLPLEYQHKNDDGSVFTFSLRSAATKPLDNALFVVPKDYKIVKPEEYGAAGKQR